jgi:hypothetical protein
MPTIARYLLHLAEHPHAAKLHTRSAKDADDQMRAFGLEKDQRDVIATGDQQKISKAITKELPPAAEPGKTMTFEISSGICAMAEGDGQE